MQLLYKVKSQSISRLDHEQPAASSINICRMGLNKYKKDGAS
jgi:hypothetical protein